MTEANKSISAPNQKLVEDIQQQIQHLTNTITTQDDLQSKLEDLQQYVSLFSEDYKKPALEGTDWSPLNDYKRRKRIEANLESLAFDVYLRTGSVEQEVTINKHLKVRYKSLRGVDTAFLEAWQQIDSLDKKPDEKSDINKLINASQSVNLLNELVLSVKTINGVPPSDSIYEVGATGILIPNLEKANKCRQVFAQMGDLTALDILLNYRWFKERVLALHSMESIQNF